LPFTDAVLKLCTPSFVAVLLVAATPWTAVDAGAQSLPSGWGVTDIGDPNTPGSATFASPILSVTSRGFDVNGSSDQFTFARTAVRGDVTLIARVRTLSNPDPWAQVGLMIRDGAGRGARHAFVFVTPGNGLAMRRRTSPNGTTSQISGGPIAASVWLRIDRRASTFIASRSVDGVSWTAIGSIAISMSSNAYVGIAIASHSSNIVTATLDNVSLNGTGWAPSNTPPAVSLTSPANGSSFASPASIALAATASDANGTVAKVDFYNGATLLASDTTSPYAFSWTGVANGTYGVRAVATDNQGASTTSATATITVASNVAPLVSMTSPSNGASFLFPLSITLGATASDPDGTIQRVQFYVGTLLVGTDTTSPYSVIWPAILGTHSVNAVATDNRGAITSSAWRDFSVTATTVLSRAIFRPAVPADAADYYLFEIFTAGANPATAVPVATQNLGLPAVVGGEITADVRATIQSLAVGNYIATVAAMSPEGKLRSNTFAFAR
jgi:hypothetical protein